MKRLYVLLPISVCAVLALLPRVAGAAFDSAVIASEGDLEILRVTPEGEDVPAGKQIVIQFNRPVVPLGRMERTAAEIPVIISPALPCEWRWINNSALACNLPDTKPLQKATRYTLDIKPGIKAEDGATIAQTYAHMFLTERPDVQYTQFFLWKSPEHPVVRVTFNQPVEKESVREHLYFALGEDATGRIPVSVHPDSTDRTLPHYVPVPGEPYGLSFQRTSPQKSDEQYRRRKGGEARRIWLVEPKKPLPLDTQITVKSEAGLISALGPEKGVSSREHLRFRTYPEFAFLGVQCVTNDDEALFVKADESATGKCNPMRSVRLVFNTPVAQRTVVNHLMFRPSIGWPKPEEEEENTEDAEDGAIADYRFRRAHSKDQTYDVYLPGGLKANQAYEMVSRSQHMGFFARLWHRVRSWFGSGGEHEVQDIFGRKLSAPVSLRFMTNHRNPNYVLDYSHAVLEKNVDSEVPFYVNNLQDYRFEYRRVSAKGDTANLSFRKEVPRVKDVQFAVPLGVREMLNGQSGALYGSLSTHPKVRDDTPTLFAQVTPYQVHVKWGHFNTLIWVTDMATGMPVADAKVSVSLDAFSTLSSAGKAAASSKTNASGLALLPGAETLDPDLGISRRWRPEDQRYFLRVEKGQDMALLPIQYSYEIDAYRTSGSEPVYPYPKERYGHMRSWGTTAQGIYRAGDTVRYKIYVRNQDNRGFIPAPSKGYHLTITDPMGKTVHSVSKITLSKFGGISGEYTVPKEGAVGWYQFQLKAELGGQEHSWHPMRVLVSDFTPSPFKVESQLNGDLFRRSEEVEVTTRATLHSGGAYADANTRITALLDSKPFFSKHPLAKRFQFDSYAGEASSQQLFQKMDRVNEKGENMLRFSTGTPKVVYGKLLVESAVSDDRGKFITGQSRADYLGVDRLVGLDSSAWLYQAGKPAEIDYIVVDEKGTPIKGTPVEIALEYEVRKAARVKGAGNAYLPEYHTEWKPVGHCKGTSGAEPSACRFTPKKAGSYRAVARIKDTKGVGHATELQRYAIGSNYVMWDNGSDSSLTVIPENTEYKVGDTARYLVKNPYPGAKALITVERYGVLDQFVQTFDSSMPTIEFKVKPDYLPGFYLSVLVVSPRVEKPLGEGQVDLGKPTYRMGYVTVPVQDPYKEMRVTVKADRDVYKPREKVSVALHAEPRAKDTREPIEFAVVVLDESVLDLVVDGIRYFDPYAGFYELEGLDVRNYSLLTRLIGRQRFEKKGANPGGDGGSDLSMRSLFKFVSYWNPSLPVDAQGSATITFDAPDNLTGWRILAMATTPSDRFGLGQGSFKVNRPTEIRPVMPNQVMEGDQFAAGFSVMNRTDKARTLQVAIHAEGNVKASGPSVDYTQTITLAPYKRATVYMPITTTQVPQTRDAREGEVRFTAIAEDAVDSDGVEHAVPVHKPRSLNVAANYGTTTHDVVEESIQFPKEMLPDVGSVSVVASPTVIGNVEGAFSYMRDYPYLCWEQRLSKGVMAAHYQSLKPYLPDSLQWVGSKSLPQRTLDQAGQFQAPGGGMSYFVAEDQYADPYLSAYTALAFGWLREAGYTVPDEVETKLHTYLSTLLKQDAVPDFYSEGMTSTVRAVALAALAKAGKADIADLERYQPHVQGMSLFGKAHYLQAALMIDEGGSYAPAVAKAVLAHANQTGGKFTFSETKDDSYSRILATPLRENCAVLSAFTAYGERQDGANLVGDVPFKLVRSITQTRQNREHWENTQENLFCMNALIEFARVYEKEKPNMRVSAALDGKPFGQAEFHDMRDPPTQLERLSGAGDVGRKATLRIERTGEGRLYYATRLSYALPMALSEAANAGIEIRREYSVQRDGKWVLLEAPLAITRGELVRVDLFVSVPAARNFVVVDDAVPGGLEPVNRDLATASEVDAREAKYEPSGGSFWFKFSDWHHFAVSRWSFYHKELRHDSVRFYSDYLPAGNYHLSYTAQAIATGSFSVLPSLVQEMYEPDVYGKTGGLTLKVDEAPTAKAPKL